MASACERSRCTILNSSSLRDITKPRHAPRAPRVSSKRSAKGAVPCAKAGEQKKRPRRTLRRDPLLDTRWKLTESKVLPGCQGPTPSNVLGFPSSSSNFSKRTRRGIHFVEDTEGDGREMFKAICKHGLEGIVSKKVDAPYRSGPSKTWVKVKNPKAPAATRALDGTF